jgi:hypothetical protein
LVAIGATSIDLGMKWGTFLLDPSSRSINAELAGSRLIPAYFGNRPADYNDDETLKVIVLMTDGENFVQERFGDAYRTGTSPIWLANDGRYSIFHDTRVDSRTTSTICNSRPFWVPHLGAWHSRPWTGSSPSSSACYVPATTSYSNTTRQNWQAVWAAVRVQWGGVGALRPGAGHKQQHADLDLQHLARQLPHPDGYRRHGQPAGTMSAARPRTTASSSTGSPSRRPTPAQAPSAPVSRSRSRTISSTSPCLRSTRPSMPSPRTSASCG